MGGGVSRRFVEANVVVAIKLRWALAIVHMDRSLQKEHRADECFLWASRRLDNFLLDICPCWVLVYRCCEREVVRGVKATDRSRSRYAARGFRPV